MRKLLLAVLMISVTAPAVQAQAKKPVAAASTQPEVVEATKQTTVLPKNAGSFTQYRFVIIWKSATPPTEGFFYRNGKEWKDGSLARPERRQFSQNSQDYMMVENAVKLSDIKNGDRIIVTTHRHAHDEEVMPAAVQKMAKEGLFYATGSAKSPTWKHIPVKLRVLPNHVN